MEYVQAFFKGWLWLIRNDNGRIIRINIRDSMIVLATMLLMEGMWWLLYKSQPNNTGRALCIMLILLTGIAIFGFFYFTLTGT